MLACIELTMVKSMKKAPEVTPKKAAKVAPTSTLTQIAKVFVKFRPKTAQVARNLEMHLSEESIASIDHVSTTGRCKHDSTVVLQCVACEDILLPPGRNGTHLGFTCPSRGCRSTKFRELDYDPAEHSTSSQGSMFKASIGE